ncbi:helix-turn-helix transcriptional regulator [Salmonella enterica]|uniref:helix-turn-helix transcriptional regulator n=1 Tax=Salmonella enterica TaxID=28901 RepID=UPI0003BD9B3E|nr:AlpA family phage regulatory protein [Salmonella enterica]APV87831.1 hypothetical protein SEEM1958_007705 [Salmonella enterica subsp. enterica serovar Mbandaka str. ATCC 51958]EBF8301024.1 AlpA family phage regulatory protein [Salmonella enterica subsp. enterica serovar Mbandaka]
MHTQTTLSGLQGKKLIRINKVIEITGRSAPSIYRDIKMKRFPKPVKTGPQSVAWLEQEIAEWIDSKIREREE